MTFPKEYRTLVQLLQGPQSTTSSCRRAFGKATKPLHQLVVMLWGLGKVVKLFIHHRKSFFVTFCKWLVVFWERWKKLRSNISVAAGYDGLSIWMVYSLRPVWHGLCRRATEPAALMHLEVEKLYVLRFVCLVCFFVWFVGLLVCLFAWKMFDLPLTSLGSIFVNRLPSLRLGDIRWFKLLRRRSSLARRLDLNTFVVSAHTAFEFTRSQPT